MNTTLQKISNHPVHIINENDDLSKSALIPFCEFGGNISLMGRKIDQFQVPVCNSFRPKILHGQLCYEVDPENYRDKYNFDEKLLSLSLLISFNEDRQFAKNKNRIIHKKKKQNSLTFETETEEQHHLFIGTISKTYFLLIYLLIHIFRTFTI